VHDDLPDALDTREPEELEQREEAPDMLPDRELLLETAVSQHCGKFPRLSVPLVYLPEGSDMEAVRNGST